MSPLASESIFLCTGVLVDEAKRVHGKRHGFQVRPQLQLLLTLMPRYRLGIFSSATLPTVEKALRSVYANLKNPRYTPQHREFLPLPSSGESGGRSTGLGCHAQILTTTPPLAVVPPEGVKTIFDVILHRDHCCPDPGVRGTGAGGPDAWSCF